MTFFCRDCFSSFSVIFCHDIFTAAIVSALVVCNSSVAFCDSWRDDVLERYFLMVHFNKLAVPRTL
jgi:hypothetical protein